MAASFAFPAASSTLPTVKATAGAQYNLTRPPLTYVKYPALSFFDATTRPTDAAYTSRLNARSVPNDGAIVIPKELIHRGSPYLPTASQLSGSENLIDDSFFGLVASLSKSIARPMSKYLSSVESRIVARYAKN